MTRQYVSQLQYVTADPPERHRRSGTPRQWWILATAGVAQLMVILDASIVNIALPSAQRTLGFADADRQWVVTAYALAFGSLLLIGGRLADLLGRNRTFVAGLAGFAGPRPWRAQQATSQRWSPAAQLREYSVRCSHPPRCRSWR